MKIMTVRNNMMIDKDNDRHTKDNEREGNGKMICKDDTIKR